MVLTACVDVAEQPHKSTTGSTRVHAEHAGEGREVDSGFPLRTVIVSPPCILRAAAKTPTTSPTAFFTLMEWQ